MLALISAAAACGLFWLVAAVIFARAFGRPMADRSTYESCTLVIGAAILANGMRLGLKQDEIAELDFFGAARLSVSQVVSAVFALLVLLVALKDQALSRLVLITYVPLLFFSLLVAYRMVPRLLATLLFSGSHQEKTLIIGSALSAGSISSWLARQRPYGIEVVGLLSDDHFPSAPNSIPFLGSTKDLEMHIRNSGCTQVMMIGLPQTSASIKAFAQISECCGARFLVVADWARMLGRRLAVSTHKGMHILSFQKEPLQCPWNRALKRALDLAISAPVVLLILPWVSVAVWLLHRWQSPGPLFFRQKRTGVHGRQFLIYKYRSMAVDHGDEARQASQNDERVFPAGRLLRKLSIDELPQFINVFLGEMSVVGPRPHLAEHDRHFHAQMRRYRIRHLVKPGITGLAQIRGLRGETRTRGDVIRRVRSDLRYIQDWSLAMDMLIVLKTAMVLFRPPKTSY